MINEEIIKRDLLNLLIIDNTTNEARAGHAILRKGIKNIIENIDVMINEGDSSLRKRVERLERITQQSEL